MRQRDPGLRAPCAVVTEPLDKPADIRHIDHNDVHFIMVEVCEPLDTLVFEQAFRVFVHERAAFCRIA